ncbi:hypothetical protein NIES2135_27140 [Leptolyngbya boryana NIES-2135]|jgi:hypothetical protein|uniref:Uncharacterized protein n=1 Tax=Leptolyngbya boryana NIES-2135 TaxID=1973484 RepID=A0A1Z4JGL7_LEPBY|nr:MULTISPECIES: hypothetical protein [Leptolyngbya]BAY55889.1 hypothetical protein NIES2135_27140 [Leptolyngbya boryana NIES-2135]MBD2368808.1 hypothetical protein [Leptolyngbya sp. FACHB-161]MBD2375324.1 hypothetical protein [Leptolyngbya sp. FACHB-238]MBD2399742.1 hypothetical protein [Leptolyngbya sp. FACHB-239]MBD2405948.1 hypothetical protein [Leptolyngbya sp. FACHB-402]
MNDLHTGTAFTAWFVDQAPILINSTLLIMKTELQIDCMKEAEVTKIAKSIDQIAILAEQLGIKTIRILHRGISCYVLPVRLALIYPIK